MMMRWKHVILCTLVLSALGCGNVFADEYTLTEENQAADSAQDENAVPDLNGWLSSVPDGGIDFDQYQEIMSIMYPELVETDEEDLEDELDVASSSNASRSNASITQF